MSTFEDDRFRWRETYFVLFRSQDRPTAAAVKKALSRLSDRLELSDLQEDDDGNFEALTLHAPDDHAALDICYLSGEEVLEQGLALAEELSGSATKEELVQIKKIPKLDARLDVLHFQEVTDAALDEDDLDDSFDPSALLLVLDAISDLTSGIAVDPQSGTLL